MSDKNPELEENGTLVTYNKDMRCLPYLIAVVLTLVAGDLRADEQYLKEIKPLLKTRCYACHGSLKQESGLRLDTAQAIRNSGLVSSGVFLERISATDPERRMPPEGEFLTAEEIALLGDWINRGALGPAEERPEEDPSKHWSFSAIVRPAIPSSQYENPIDAFLDAKRRAMGIKQVAEADRHTLIRRIYIDLIGMPPTLSELESLQTGTKFSPTELIKKLLEDSRHGERWGRHWMDVWRYSDWWGLGAQLRNSQKHIWHWRDWIVESLNDDLGYDEMIRQMLAADELYPNDLQKLRGGGFLARNWFLFNRNQWMDETVEHVGKAFLGLTFNCAKCHDHKYDPIAQRDYYQMRAFFEPYHVRMDMVPGETDLVKDGIPRPFDADLDVPTYLFLRGNDKHPELDEALSPGVPSVFQLPLPPIEPVELPIDAWQPGLRSDVIDSYLNEMQTQVTSRTEVLAEAKIAFANAQQRLKEYRANPDPGEFKGDMIFADDFTTLDREKWEVFGGNWELRDEGLFQLIDGAQRSVLRLKKKMPRDFEATLQFVTTGGSKWRSVGIEFDGVSIDPSKDLAKGENAQNIYISGYQPAPKIQGSYNIGGGFQYPPQGARPIKFEINRQYEFRIQVRDTLVNAFLDGELVVAWRTPIARRDGAIQLSTFDVLPIFKSFEVRELPESVKLVEALASGEPQATAPIDPEKAAVDAETALELAEIELDIAREKYRHLQVSAEWYEEFRTRGDQASEEARQAAVLGERRLKLMELERDLFVAKSALKKGGAPLTELEKAVREKTQVLNHTRQQMEKPIEKGATVELLTGAKWTPTRFASSGSDDTEMKFLPTSSGRRTSLATWITNPRNPLTARVAVNHVWLRHMGRPLVETVFDFGRNGKPPAHQELLDWLAAEFIASGWRFKHLHELIMSSDAYKMKSVGAGSDQQLAVDPENRLWWRRETVRLESQAVRDSVLRLGNQLDLTRGGKPVEPSQQVDSKRRSLYFFHSNNSRNLFLTMFDEALVTDCYRREESIVPQQALAMANSSLVLQNCAPIVASLNVVGLDDRGFVEKAFVYLLGRQPNSKELDACLTALEKWRDIPSASEGLAQESLIWVLLNHNDFVTLR